MQRIIEKNFSMENGNIIVLMLIIYNIYVERNKDKQFEYIENGKYYYEFDIDLITDCKYELTYKGTTSPNSAAAKIGEKFTIEIIKINDSEMEYKTTFRNLEDVGKMTRIR